MSFTMHGIGVCGGIAIGHAHLISHAMQDVLYFVLPKLQIPSEVERFDSAIKQTRGELTALRDHLSAGAPAEMRAFLDLHLMLLEDPAFSEIPRQIIEERRCNAEWALKQQVDVLVAQFDDIEDEYLRERKADVIQVAERVLKILLGHPSLAVPASSPPKPDSILVAHDLSPADMLLFKQHQFSAFVTDVGGTTSHTAIMARSLGLPSVVALHQARALVREGEKVIVDGSQGVIIVNPDPLILEEYRLKQEHLEQEKQKLRRLKSTRATTLDGTPVKLHANIELPEDLPQVKEHGATGIGLYRSEFLFMNRDDLPSEEEQYEAYRKVAEDLRGLPVTIRTLDLGADKNLRFSHRKADNPALGLRAIRLCLAEPLLFHTQLRALLRASHHGKVRILIPMLSSLAELNQTLHLIENAKKSLAADKLPFDRSVSVGGMIEVPGAALMVQAFARKLSFLSIGTNDLIQYTLAIDRTDDSVAHLYDPLHPAVLQLVAHTIRVADRVSLPISICGEMAGDARLTRLLLGFGLREFSMHPAHLLAVKQIILKTDVPETEALAQRILRTSDPDRLRALIDKLNGVA